MKSLPQEFDLEIQVGGYVGRRDAPPPWKIFKVAKTRPHLRKYFDFFLNLGNMHKSPF